MRETLTERTDISKLNMGGLIEAGLDAELYLAVLSAELGVAGRVNANGRIYKVNEFIQQNARLSERLQTEFIDGERGHPSGPPTFDVPVRLVSVEVKESGDTAMAMGNFAVLNTQAGRDILTLYKAKMPIGVSSRGTGVLESQVIDEESPYYSANTDYDGESVDIVHEFELDRYDLVRVPSAGTHVEATEETREAFARLTEAGFISHNQEDATVSEIKKEESVDLELEGGVEAPAQGSIDVETVRKEAYESALATFKENDPFAQLTGEQRSVFVRIAEALTVPEDSSEDSELVSEVTLLRKELETQNAKIHEEHESLRLEVEALRNERDLRVRQDAIEGAIQSCTSEKKYGVRVAAQLNGLLEEGVIDSVESVTVFADRFFALAEGLSSEKIEATGDAVIEAEDAKDDIVDPGVDVEAVTEGPGLLNNQQFHEQMKKILERDRLALGKGN
tara:strand:- start:9131 stop:10480 length:1350 start_codon:yes stop_codon:yes gene_type:complete